MSSNIPPKDDTAVCISISYGLLTFFTFFFELGILVWGISYLNDISVPLFLLLIFRISHVLSGQIIIRSYLLCMLAFLLGSLLFYSSKTIAGYSVSIFVIEFALHSLRETFKPLVRANRRFWKDVPRAIGFTTSFLFSPIILLVLTFTTIIVLLISKYGLKALPSYKAHVDVVTDYDKIRFAVPEYMFVFLHHLQFFIYCYILLFYLKGMFQIRESLLGVVYLIGWIGYFIVDYFVPAKKRWLFCGHILCAVCIALIPFSPSLFLILSLWFLTGVGGGTIFLRRYFKNRAKYSEIVCDVYEGIGQSLGIIFSIFIVVFVNSPHVIFLTSAIVAGASAYSALRIAEIRGQ